MSQPINPLQASLQQEISVMTQLADVLKAEQTALVDGDVAALSELTQSKSRLVANIAELEHARNQAIAAKGFADDIQGFKDYLASTTDTALSQAWDELLRISEAAKETNRTNGMLINRHLARNQGALNALQQNKQPLYGPSGQSTTQANTGRGFVVG